MDHLPPPAVVDLCDCGLPFKILTSTEPGKKVHALSSGVSCLLCRIDSLIVQNVWKYEEKVDYLVNTSRVCGFAIHYPHDFKICSI